MGVVAFIKSEWRSNNEKKQAEFKGVVFSGKARGLNVLYKAWLNAFTVDMYLDGNFFCSIGCGGTASYRDVESISLGIPDIEPGTYDIKFECRENGYFEEFEFTSESVYDGGIYEIPTTPIRDTNNDLIVATDELGRKLPTASEAGTPKNKLVGIFYWTWRNQNIYASPRSLHEILKIAPEAEYDINHPIWTNKDMVHWKEPLYGFYRNDDPYVLRKHAQYFANAGVDVVIFDNTNGALLWKDSFVALCEEFKKCREDGIKTPCISFIMNFGPMESTYLMLKSLYQDIYKPGLYKDLWFMWNGKPLIMAYPEAIPAEGKNEYETQLLNEMREFFTFRPGQPLYGGGPTRADHWGWLEKAPQNGYVKKENGKYEMCTVGVAQNANPELICTCFNNKDTFGRSYTFKDGHGRLTKDSYKYGYNVQEQWDNALKIDPDFVFVTGWNEWMMGKFPGEPWIKDPNSTQIGFVDQYDLERSRDIEPDRDGYMDSYYLQLTANIRRFKGLKHIPHSCYKKSINIKNISDWDDVRPEYKSHKGTEAKRNYSGLGQNHYVNMTGRNNIISSKTAHDSNFLYFTANCSNDIKGTKEHDWMVLLLDVDRNKSTGWEGYDYKITAGTCFRYEDGAWKPVGKAEYYVEGTTYVVKIPLATLGMTDTDAMSYEFKWADNIKLDNIMNFYENGDCAPFGRFNYVVSSDDR